LLVQETISTFADDCSTPKISFALGEMVCAKTDGADLNFPGGRWVHWLRQDLSIAFGGSGTTLITANPQTFSFIPDQAGTWKVSIAETNDISQTTATFTVGVAPSSVETYESTCMLRQDSFTIGTSVCAKVDPNFAGTRYLYWVNSQGEAVQTDEVNSTNASAIRLMDVAGNWSVYFSDADGSLISKHSFAVSNPQEPTVDLSVFKTQQQDEVFTGGLVSFVTVVGNQGPDTASSITLTDSVPTNASLVSFNQDSGPAFNCTTGSSNTVCNIASLQAGARASFTSVFQLNDSASTEIASTSTLTSTTSEIHTEDNTWLVPISILSGTAPSECTLDCPQDVVTTATTHGQGGGANITFGGPEVFGSCGTINTNPASGSFFPIGTTIVTAMSSTGQGTCSFTVTVVDTAGPTISCPTNITVTANAGSSTAFVPDPNGSSSNIGSPTTTGDQPLDVTGSREDGDGLTTPFPLGTTAITWLATDPNGRQATCTQFITVIPDHVLTISCPADVSVSTPNGCDPATVNIGRAASNSTSATISAQRSDGLPLSAPYSVGTTTVTWSANDTDTQSASCTQTITVTGTDTTPPTLTVPPNVSVTTSSCSALVDDELGVAMASDDCGSVSITRTGLPTVACPTPQDPNRQCESFVFQTGSTVITYTAKNSSGLITTGTQTVTVTEDPAVPPTITAPAAVTLFTGAGASSCGVSVSNLDTTLGVATANDNCAGVSVTRSNVPAGNVFPLGNTLITYTATDKSGNIATDTQLVTVVDHTPPVVTAPGPVTLFTGPGTTSCGVTISNLDATLGTGSAEDNCSGVGAVSRSGVPSGNVFPVGDTTITYSATDAHGNTAQAMQVVTVIDNTAPSITCPANITLEPTCPNGAAASWVAPTGSDNCSGAATTQTAGPASGTVFPIATTSITYTVTDAYGNSTSCSFTVTVLTPQTVVQNLMTAVSGSSLTGTQKNGLLAKLTATLDAINQGKTNVACNKLSDFVNNVHTLISHGDLSAAQGNAWINSANHVRNTIGCTTLPCS